MDTVTIVVHDTIQEFIHDTVTVLEYHDTVTVVNNERVSLKYFYDTTHKEIHHKMKCKEIAYKTEVREPVVRIMKPTLAQQIKEAWWMILIVAGAVWYLRFSR